MPSPHPGRAACLGLFLALAIPAALVGQATPRAADLELRAFAATYLEVGRIREEIGAKLALSENKTEERQAALRSDLKERIAQSLQAHGLTQATYDRYEYLVTTSEEWRAAFERRLAAVRAVRPTPPR